MLDFSEACQQLQSAGEFLLASQLTWGNAGNLSMRLDSDRYVVTASGTQLGELGMDDFVECSLTGASPSGQRKPSKETPMHRAIYEQRPEVSAVLHASPFYSTLISCSTEGLPANWFVEDMYYLERVARVAYFHPGSQALGDAVYEKAKQANILLLENHGVLVYDTSLRKALMGLQTLEMVCHMLVTARSAGIQMRELSQDVVTGFLQDSGYRPRREWPA